ncbi:hypothetical protein L218DRAFT_1038614 [Marasmius fiardii PR-910]|nr:hypothetical protein L218DRAFT_1038614 [Marasmius fiardii PR-910]
MLKSASYLVTLTGLAVFVSAQAPQWGQCGGIGWTGPTSCVVGSTCTKQNEYYSQCLPGTNAPTSTSTTGGGASTPVPPTTANANYWFSFGDSYTQTGFDITSTPPAVGNPLGNPPYPGWTATGGENWIDYDTTAYNKSLVLTYNFAYGGATIDATLVPPYTPTVQSLTDQVNSFLSWNSGAGKGLWKAANTLFSIWIGINDIGNSYYQSGDRSAFSDTLLNAEFALVQKLLVPCDAGARNFLFVNVPPVQRSPLMVPQGTSATTLEGTVINGFNTKLNAKRTSFQSSHSGVKTYLYDSYTGFSKILDNPKAYGFRDNSTYGDGADIFWGNNYHPSSYAHKYFAQDVAQVLTGTVW